MEDHHRYWLGWEVTCARTASTEEPAWLGELFREAGMYSVLVELLFFISEFSPCGGEAIPYARFALTADLQAGIKYYAFT